MVARSAVAVATIAAALACAGCGGGSSSTGSPPTAGSCADVSTPKPRSPAKLEAPSGRLDAAKHWTLTFQTSCGSFEVRLAPQTSPRATASLVALARSRFFDGTIFHRIVPGFVIQGGDPTQSGSGGPGYSVDEPPRSNAQYTKGTVAMARTAIEPPGRSGSMFFVVTATDAG